jgi:hypothetical protein
MVKTAVDATYDLLEELYPELAGDSGECQTLNNQFKLKTEPIRQF